MLAKSADIWLSGQHVADMPGTFPAKSPAPKDQKTCCLYQVNSNVSPYTCDWTNAMNHFEYLRETSDDVLTDDDKHRAYKGRGGIYMRCHPFDLHEPWEDILKRLPSSSEDFKKSTSKEISKDSLIASITKNDISTVQVFACHQALVNADTMMIVVLFWSIVNVP